MPQDEGIKGYYYALVDKSWSFAEWMEEKGIPLATFCDRYHINPLLLILAIVLAAIVISMLVLGGVGGVSYGTLEISVTSGGKALEGATVSYTFNGITTSNETDMAGSASLSFPIGVLVELTASKSGYEPATENVTLQEETGTQSFSLARRVGDLEVTVTPPSGQSVPSSAYVVISDWDENIDDQKPITSGKALFTGLPAGATINAYVKVGSQRIPSDGIDATIVAGEVAKLEITIPDEAFTTSLEVRVKDDLGNSIDGADVTLYDWTTGTKVSNTKTTSLGSVSFEDLAKGTSIYIEVDPNDPTYSSYNGKTSGEKIDLTGSTYPYDITLTALGKVEVCVRDDDTGAFLTSGKVELKGTSGQTYQYEYITGSCVDFIALPQYVSIYPVVTANGYQTHDNPAEAKTVDYSQPLLSFDVSMVAKPSNEMGDFYVSVSDENGNTVDGIKVKVMDAQDVSDILESGVTDCIDNPPAGLDKCGIFKTRLEVGAEVYAVAYDEDYVLATSSSKFVSDGGVIQMVVYDADDTNSGDVEVCAYKNGAPAEAATIELYDDVSGKMLWKASTDEEKDSHCYTFKNIPDGTTVYAKATNLGAAAEESDTVVVTAGKTEELIVYVGTEPVILKEGNVKVCVKEAGTGAALAGAEVELRDNTTDSKIVTGVTSSNGCVGFKGVVAEANDNGTVVPRGIYITVNRTNYAEYNSKASGKSVKMIPEAQLTVNVELKEAYPICVSVVASDTGAPLEAKVVLYYNETADAVKKKKTDDNGTVIFYQSAEPVYYFRVEEDYNLYQPDEVYEFDNDSVSGGACGVITIYSLADLCDLGIEVLDGNGPVRVPLGEAVKIPIRVMKGGERGDNSIEDEGTTTNKHTIILSDFNRANLTIRLNGDFQASSLGYESTTYSSDQEIVATMALDKGGDYSGIVDLEENSLCAVQDTFNIEVYEETLSVQSDSFSFNPDTDNHVTFCIYVKDQDGKDVTDASVSVSVDEMDGWTNSGARAAKYDDAKKCYKGTITSTVAKGMAAGDYPFYITAQRAGVQKIAEAEASIEKQPVEEPCGNGVLDSGEECDPGAAGGCRSGYSCSLSCTCEPEAGPTGQLRVSADEVTLSIGSGTSSGFCVYVQEENGSENKDARVSINLYSSEGWPQDYSRSGISYDISRGCYYASLSENVAWPSGYKGSTSGMTGTKTIYVSATEGDRVGTATTSAVVNCGCDEESYCDYGCPCDDDCEKGGFGSLDLFGCLQLAGQRNYYPQGMPSPYMYNPYNQGGYQFNQGSLAMSGPGGAGIGLNWDQCKKIFGDLGWDSLSSSKSVGYVLVQDKINLITGDRNSAGPCKDLLDSLQKLSGFKYAYVNQNCCTGGSCDKKQFEALIDTAMREDSSKVTLLDIVELTPNIVDSYGLRGYYVVESNNGGRVLYKAGTDYGLFSKGAVLFTGVTKSPYSKYKPGSKAGNYYLLGILDDDVKTQVKNNIRTYIDDDITLSYPDGIDDDYKTIIVSPYEIPDVGGVWLRGDEPDFSRLSFASLATGTKLKVYSDYATSTTNSIASAIRAVESASMYPKFEKVSTNDISYCPDKTGEMKELGSELVLLKLNEQLYMVGQAPSKTCTKDNKNDKITTYTGLKDEPQGVGYVKTKGDASLYMFSDRPSLQAFANSRFNMGTGEEASSPPAPTIFAPPNFEIVSLEGGITLVPNYMLFDPEDLTAVAYASPARSAHAFYDAGKGYSLIKQGCETANVCYGTNENSLKSELADEITDLSMVPDSNAISQHIMECACVGKAEKPDCVIKGTVKLAPDVTDVTLREEGLSIYLKNEKTGVVGTYDKDSSDEEANIECSGNKKNSKCTFEIYKVPYDDDLRLWARWGKEGTTTNGARGVTTYNCVGMDLTKAPELKGADRSPGQVVSQVDSEPIVLKLIHGVCDNDKVADQKSHNFKITGTVKDLLGHPIPGPGVKVEITGYGLPLKPTPIDVDGTGHFTTTLQNLYGTEDIEITAKYIGADTNNPDISDTIKLQLYNYVTSSASNRGGRGTQTAAYTVDIDNKNALITSNGVTELKLKKTIYAGIDGKLVDTSGGGVNDYFVQVVDGKGNLLSTQGSAGGMDAMAAQVAAGSGPAIVGTSSRKGYEGTFYIAGRFTIDTSYTLQYSHRSGATFQDAKGHGGMPVIFTLDKQGKISIPALDVKSQEPRSRNSGVTQQLASYTEVYYGSYKLLVLGKGEQLPINPWANVVRVQ